MTSSVKIIFMVCAIGIVAVFTEACTNTGEWCQRDINCCGAAVCYKGVCRLMRCRPTGYRCKYHNECCQGFCSPSSPYVKTCTKPDIDDINAYLGIRRRALW
ncbi:uncharacterized protein LOC106171564 [Lingula anatina]|uniref:Uncharacterized protein LOC106171564 n=1 Tax=Lingula anatina TaxID=7574 RepID=A0A1S3JAJ6_LINAN|nr:uncharacterized protein LOC106171564 [Lingula anatina]|eukprot:XP_013407422.1 uncharacterized protein LOC106171564 [Lingula anatina]